MHDVYGIWMEWPRKCMGGSTRLKPYRPTSPRPSDRIHSFVHPNIQSSACLHKTPGSPPQNSGVASAASPGSCGSSRNARALQKLQIDGPFLGRSDPELRQFAGGAGSAWALILVNGDDLSPHANLEEILRSLVSPRLVHRVLNNSDESDATMAEEKHHHERHLVHR